MKQNLEIESLKSSLFSIGLDLEIFSNNTQKLINNDVLRRYKKLQEAKIGFDEQKYKNNEYYDKLEFKSIVINNKIKNILQTKQKWLIEKNTLIKYYKKEMVIADKYAEINKEVEHRLKQMELSIDNRIEDEYKTERGNILRGYYLDITVIVLVIVISTIFL